MPSDITVVYQRWNAGKSSRNIEFDPFVDVLTTEVANSPTVELISLDIFQPKHTASIILDVATNWNILTFFGNIEVVISAVVSDLLWPTHFSWLVLPTKGKHPCRN